MSYFLENRRLQFTFCFVLVVLGYYFSTIGPISAVREELLAWVTIIPTCAFALPFIRLFRRGIRIITTHTDRERYLWILTIAVSVITILVGLIPPISTSSQFDWIYTYVYLNTSIGYTTLATFYLISASYRAYKVKSIEGFVLMIAAVAVFLSNAPLTVAFWSGFEPIGQWFARSLTSAVFRGIIITASVGFVGLVVRILLGKERVSMAA
jgi:hypothetical protein